MGLEYWATRVPCHDAKVPGNVKLFSDNETGMVTMVYDDGKPWQYIFFTLFKNVDSAEKFFEHYVTACKWSAESTSFWVGGAETSMSNSSDIVRMISNTRKDAGYSYTKLFEPMKDMYLEMDTLKLKERANTTGELLIQNHGIFPDFECVVTRTNWNHDKSHLLKVMCCVGARYKTGMPAIKPERTFDLARSVCEGFTSPGRHEEGLMTARVPEGRIIEKCACCIGFRYKLKKVEDS
jgi:hypothetical protein